MDSLRIFVRQPFTESGDTEKNVVQGTLDILRALDGNPYKVEVPTGFEAQSGETFRETYERDHGIPFTPQNFRTTRLKKLHESHAMLIIRTGLSESGAFEVSYNIFGGRRIPMLFAIWNQTPIKTTLLRDLSEIAEATYVTFEEPSELEGPLREFLSRVAEMRLAGAAAPQEQAETPIAAPVEPPQPQPLKRTRRTVLNYLDHFVSFGLAGAILGGAIGIAAVSYWRLPAEQERLAIFGTAGYLATFGAFASLFTGGWLAEERNT